MGLEKLRKLIGVNMQRKSLNFFNTINFILFNRPSSEFGLHKYQKIASLQLILDKQKNGYFIIKAKIVLKGIIEE